MKDLIHKYFFWLLALESLAWALGMVLAPTRSLKLAAPVALTGLLLAALAVWLGRSPVARGRLSAALDALVAHQRRFHLATGACALLFAAGCAWLFAPVDSTEGWFNLYLVSWLPVAWLAVCAAQTWFALFAWRGLNWPLPDEQKKIVKASLIILAAFLLLWALIAVTRLGLDPVGVFWYAPGTPLLLVQLLVAWALGIALLFAERRWNGTGRRLDALLAISLWGLAALLWISTPVTRPTIFQPKPVAPNYAPYPFSDSANYDANAQGFLIGAGLSLDPSLKPAYSFFLAILHLLAGQDYERMAQVQILFLALTPVFLYALGVLLSNRPAGLIAALLFILREKNAIELANVIQVAHAKLLLSDLPTTGLIVALMVFAVGWLLKPETRRLWPLAAGGVLGLLLLLRVQVIVLVPFILLGAALALYRSRRALLIQGVLLMLVGALASLLPWAGYGYFANAQLKSPDYLHLLALQLRSGPVEELKQLPGESMAAFDARIQAAMLDYAREDPARLAGSVTAYFFRNIVQSVSYLPLSPQLESDVFSYARRMPFWDDWRGDLPAESRSMLALHLALVALGLAALWTRFRRAALLLALLLVSYLTSLALPMLSGWRFLLPADWIVAFCLALGLMELTLLGRSLFNAHPTTVPVITAVSLPEPASPLSWPRLAFLTLFFLLLNLSLPLGSVLIPVRYPPQTDAQLLKDYAKKTTRMTVAKRIDAATLTAFLKQKNAVALRGRALYPRFFAAGDGLRSTGWASFSVREYSRIGFYLAGPSAADVVLSTAQSPSIFPHAADVQVFGCLREPEAYARRFVEAWVVVVQTENDIFLRAPGPAPDCAARP